MPDQTQSGMIRAAASEPENQIGAADREILRRLAAQVAQRAARPIESEKRDLWYRHNRLEATRPLIFCDPENGWNEIITQDQLLCRGTLARGWEMTLCKEIFWADSLRDDRVIEPFFDVRHIYDETDWGMHERRIGGGHGGSFTWDPPLKTYDGLDKLHFPQITIDAAATQGRLDLARSILGDLLTVRLRTRWWWTLGMTETAANLRGLEQLMLDMYDFPDELKRLMAFLRDGTMARLDFLESHGLLAPNQDSSYVGSGGFGFSSELAAAIKPAMGSPVPPSTAHASPAGMWGFCESQETVGIAPDMFAEFVFPYQLPLLNRFGLNCYGCCEPLDLRWRIIKNAPRLRRVSVSPWANVERMAGELADRFVFSWKPSPSDLAVEPMDEDHARKILRHTLDATRGCRLEMIMKDNHTLANNPGHAIRWCQIAREEIARAYPGA